jgi:AcrR family transcriptional regulator
MHSPRSEVVIRHPGTPRSQPWKEQRHQQILDAAFDEFAERGYESTRLDDVAKRAGIAKGTIYLYFKNKELLFRAVLRDQITHVLSDFAEYAQNSPSSSEDLLRELLVRQYSELVGNAKARSIIRLLISESRKFPQLAEIYYNDIVLPGVCTIRQILEKGASSGQFGAQTVTAFPQILIAPAILAVLWSLIFGERHTLDFEAYREAHLQFVLSGLRGGPAGVSPASLDGKQECP